MNPPFRSPRGDALSAILVTALALTLLGAFALPSAHAANPAPAFFAFDNGVGHSTGWTAERQAALLARLGYDGIGLSGIERFDERAAAFRAARLRVFSVYVGLAADPNAPVPARLLAALPALGAQGTDVWLTVPRKTADPAPIVANIQALAEAAARHGVRIVLYPHKGHHTATAEDALALVRAVARPNVGLTLNLAHELAAGHAARLGEIVRTIAPHIMLVSINGADPTGGWPELIRPLDAGRFDVRGLLRQLAEASYRGPIGLQCYNIPLEPETHLSRSIATWRAWHASGP
jgi:sugar phosphate isomerase/epimerase